MTSFTYEMQMAKLSGQLSKYKDELVQMNFSDTLCDRTDYPTQLLSSLASDPFIGLMPQEDINIVISSLLWFHGIKDNDPVLQLKARSWAGLQLQCMTRVPLEFLNQHTYLCSTSIPQCLTKVISVVEHNIGMIMKQIAPSDLINVLSRIGLISLKQKCLPLSTIESILNIFQKSKPVDSIYKQPLVSEFLNILSESIQQGNVHLSSAAVVSLLSCHKRSARAEVITLLTHASAVHSISDVAIIQASVRNSQLPLVSSIKPSVFQYALDIMISSWLNSEGHPGFGYLIAQFVVATEKLCQDLPLVSLFPEKVQHLARLFSLPALVFSFEESVNFQKTIEAALRALDLELCTSNDLSIFMVIFPSVYHRILLAAAQENDSTALDYLRALWKSSKSKTNKELILMARRYCHNIWLCLDVDL